MNPNIILAGQQPDIVNVLRRSTAAAQEANEVQSQNALRQLYRQQGPQIMAGEQGAMNALARHDPMQAQAMNAQRAQMEQQAQAWKMRVAEYARGLKAEEAAAEAQQIEAGIKRAFVAFQAGDLNGVNAILEQAGEQPIQSLDQFPAVVSRYGDALTILKDVVEFGAGPKPADEYQRYAQEEQAAGRQPLSRIEYAQAKKGAPGPKLHESDGTLYDVSDPKNPQVILYGTPKPADEYQRYVQEEQAYGRKPLTRIEYAKAKQPKSSISVGPDGSVRITEGDVTQSDGRLDPTSPATMVASIDGILNDPAFEASTGILSPLQSVPGTPQRRFGSRVKQLEGQAFLQAFESLKGGGQITEVEGIKATQAIARLDSAQRAEDYREALQELRELLVAAQSRPRGWADQKLKDANTPEPGVTEDGYRFLGGDPGDPQNWQKVK